MKISTRRYRASILPCQTRRRATVGALAAAVALALPAAGASAGAPKSLQRLIDRARRGSVLTVPPGAYAAGVVVGKPLTLRMKGVRFVGDAGPKAVLNVRLNGGPVVIEDFTATDATNCTSRNCVGIKIEGRNFRVTIRRAHIAHQVMGVLTDNRGGTLVIENSLIEEEGHPHSALSHLVYAGEIGRLVIRHSILRRSLYLGHLLKSRAVETVVEDSRLLGLDGNHSRSIDLSCGGTLVVRNSVIQHGRRSDNADMIAIGTEPKNCRTILPGRVLMTGNWIISDRRPVTADPTRPPARNTLFTWRSTGDNRLVATGNKIVNVRRWSGDRSWRVPDLATGNSLYPDRAAAGLGPDDIPHLLAVR